MGSQASQDTSLSGDREGRWGEGGGAGDTGTEVEQEGQ